MQRGEEDLSLSDSSQGPVFTRLPPGNAAAPHQQKQSWPPCQPSGKRLGSFGCLSPPPCKAVELQGTTAGEKSGCPPEGRGAVRARRPRGAEGSGPARCPQPSGRPYPRLPLGGTSPPGMSRPKPPGPSQPCPGGCRAPRGLRRGAAAVGAAPARSVCPRSGPSLHPSRARLPRPPSHSSSQ